MKQTVEVSTIYPKFNIYAPAANQLTAILTRIAARCQDAGRFCMNYATAEPFANSQSHYNLQKALLAPEQLRKTYKASV
jgi:hypothetical protein